MPSGGAGLYFFYTNFYADDSKVTDFVIRVNGAELCNAKADMDGASADNGIPSCGAVIVLAEGTNHDVTGVFV